MSKLTAIEKFVKEHLTRINHRGNEVEFDYEGGNYGQSFVDDPLEGIKAAIESIKQWENFDES